MELISRQELLETSPVLRKMGGKFLIPAIFKILHFNEVNQFYSENQHVSGSEFIDNLVRHTGISYTISETDLQKIPRTGSFITVSNHPYGGLDGILLARIFSGIHPGYKILVNFLLTRIVPLQPYFLGVNPFETRKDVQSSFGGLKEALLHLQQGMPLGIFPAGEVSSYQSHHRRIEDREWQFSMLKFIKRARVPVVPVYFSGHNSILFNALGMVHPALRTIRLPAELMRKKGHKLTIRIGTPISVKEQDAFREIHEYGKMLRIKTYSLQLSSFTEQRSRIQSCGNPMPVINQVDPNRILKEIEEIQGGYMLFNIQENRIFCVPSAKIPNIMREISRLREITYREVGEGTNKAADQDRYDDYFEQLFIWDDAAKKLVGGYRIGKGDEIIERFGIEGHYIHSLFKIDKSLEPLLRVSMELGRSFIVKEYQKKPLSLFLLWKGILYLLLKAPRYRYLLGPVSIPNEISELSKGLQIEFLKANSYNSELGACIRARNSFRTRIPKNLEIQAFLRYTNKDITLLEKFIQDIDPKFKIPILLKKYLSVNAEVLGFNIDPLFNNCLDALIILDLFEVPFVKIESLAKEIDDQSILDRFRK